MPFDWTINIVSLTGLVLAVLSGIVFIDRTNTTAATANKKAVDAAEDLEAYKRNTESRLQVVVAAIALIREQFVRKEDLQHLEAGIKDEFRELNKRLDSFFRDFAKRGSE